MRFLLDASTIIAMARAGRLDVLRRAAAPARTTAQVRDELLRREDETSPAIAEALTTWLAVLQNGKAGGRFLRLGLGHGEASLLASAGSYDVVVIDERPARLLARSQGIPFTGLVGLLVDAAREGRVQPREAREAMDLLSSSGFWLSPALLVKAKAELDELG